VLDCTRECLVARERGEAQFVWALRQSLSSMGGRSSVHSPERCKLEAKDRQGTIFPIELSFVAYNGGTRDEAVIGQGGPTIATG